MRVRPTVPAVLVLIPALVLGCQTTPENQVDVRALLKERAGHAYLSGTTTGLGEPAVVNNKDFIYAVAFDDDTDELAFVHHVSTFMELSLTSVEPVVQHFQTPVNHHEFDIEDVVFVEGSDQRYVVTPSRQGILRRFDVATGAPRGEFIYGQPLIRTAVNPSQTLIAVGSADGRVLVLDAATLAFRAETHPHRDEVHGLAFADDGTLLSVGFDGELVALALEPGGPDVVRAPSTELEQGSHAFLAHLDGSKAVSTIRDVRQPYNVITSAAVKRLGLETVMDGTSLSVVGPLGLAASPAVELGEVQIRYLSLGRMRAAVCDACVPPGAELILGQQSLRRVIIGDDVATDEVLLKPGVTPGLPVDTSAAAPPAESEPRAAAGAPTDATPTDATPTGATPTGATPTDATPTGATPASPPRTAASEIAQRIPGSLHLRELRRVSLPGPATDIDLDAARRTALVTYSHARAERSIDLYEAEKKGLYPPPSPASGAVLVDVKTLELGRRFIGHKGFTVTGTLSPDGRTVATGGWDDRLLVFDATSGKLVAERKLAWLLRRIRFSPDGRLLAAAGWTPANPIGDGKSEPSLLLYPVVFSDPKATGGARAATAHGR